MSRLSRKSASKQTSPVQVVVDLLDCVIIRESVAKRKLSQTCLVLVLTIQGFEGETVVVVGSC